MIPFPVDHGGVTGVLPSVSGERGIFIVGSAQHNSHSPRRPDLNCDLIRVKRNVGTFTAAGGAQVAQTNHELSRQPSAVAPSHPLLCELEHSEL